MAQTDMAQELLVEPVADKEEQLSRLVDHVVDEVRQRKARKQDRGPACDENDRGTLASSPRTRLARRRQRRRRGANLLRFADMRLVGIAGVP
jgi:hypothetical protein